MDWPDVSCPTRALPAPTAPHVAVSDAAAKDGPAHQPRRANSPVTSTRASHSAQHFAHRRLPAVELREVCVCPLESLLTGNQTPAVVQRPLGWAQRWSCSLDEDVTRKTLSAPIASRHINRRSCGSVAEEDHPWMVMSSSERTMDRGSGPVCRPMAVMMTGATKPLHYSRCPQKWRR